MKKTAADKRAALPRAADYASSFLKDWQRLSRSGRYDMNRLRHVMLLLIGGEALGPEWSDHALTGNWKGFRECHIGGDFLLIYRLEDSGRHELIVFVRAGTHAVKGCLKPPGCEMIGQAGLTTPRPAMAAFLRC